VGGALAAIHDFGDIVTELGTKKQSQINLKAVWSIPAIILLVMIYSFLSPTSSEESLEQMVTLSAFFASVACVLCIAATGYRLTSFLTILGIAHLIYYPIAATLNLLLDEPAVRPDLWQSTPLAMWACAIGCATMAFGGILWKTLGPKDVDRKPPALVGVEGNLILWAFLALSVLLRFALGMYDERFVGTSVSINDEIGHYQNIIAYLTRFSLVGILLQLYRAMNSRSSRDVLIFFAMAGTFILAFLPTGNRAGAYGWLPWFFLFYLAFEKKVTRAAGVFLILLTLFSLLTIVTNFYRVTHQLNKPIADRYQSMVKVGSTLFAESDLQIYLGSFVGRLSDNANAGRIVDYTPEVTPFRGAYGLDELWMIVVPKILFRDRASFQTMDVSMDDYDVTQTYLKGGAGSAPCMIIGDLFSRWGWPGVLGGMFVIGILVSAVSHFFVKEWTIQSVCFYALFVQYIASITQAGVFAVIVLFTRELLIAWIISRVLARFLPTGPLRAAGRVPQQKWAVT
jgi:hypothetical protein